LDWRFILIKLSTVRSQKNGAVSNVNMKCISHPTRGKRTPSAAATVQVSYALPAVRFSCLRRGRGVSFQDGVDVWNISIIWEQINGSQLSVKYQEQIEVRDTCYHSPYNILFFSLLSKNIKIYRTITLPIVLYGCETLSFTLRDERRLRVFRIGH
jgi:hypothetical protein